MKKVFLGGTCAGWNWRDELIPLLEKSEIDYFNPIVKDWTQECIAIEEDEKDNKCDIHLYLITPDMVGVYSIAEMMCSSMLYDKDVIFVIYGFKNDHKDPQVKSLLATRNLANKHSNGKFLSNFMNEEEGLQIVVDMIENISMCGAYAV